MDWLVISWGAIIGFCIIMYVILDGFTLGTGMMMGFFNKEERTIAMSAILPTWDGNQTWLVLGMASLYGAFPLAFSILLPTLYIPLILMLMALLIRGVIFEFRLKAIEGQKRWDFLFVTVCVIIALIQGSIMGNVIQGFDGTYQWLNGFSILTAVFLVFAYALSGATRLIIKTKDKMQKQMIQMSAILSIIVAIFLVLVSIASIYAHPDVAKLWLNRDYWPYLVFFPVLTALCFITLWISLKKGKELLPYWCVVVIFLCCYAGFILDVFPYAVPYHLSIFQAASPDNTLRFTFVGACIMIPFLLLYTGYSYRIFRGKVDEVIEY